jgi:hypothetical protein
VTDLASTALALKEEDLSMDFTDSMLDSELDAIFNEFPSPVKTAGAPKNYLTKTDQIVKTYRMAVRQLKSPR